MHTKEAREGQALNKCKEGRKETKKNVVRVRQKGKDYVGKPGEQLILDIMLTQILDMAVTDSILVDDGTIWYWELLHSRFLIKQSTKTNLNIF